MRKVILVFLMLVLTYQIGKSQQFNSTFNTVAFFAETDDPFTGRKQELYSVTDSQSRTHIAWIKDNGNSRIMMYSVVDGSTVTHHVVDSDSVLNQEKKHPVLVLDNNERPHLAWFVKRDPGQSCCPIGNFAVMYAGDANGDGVFEVSQVSTNPRNPQDDTETEFTDSWVNYMPSIMISGSGEVEVAYISNTYSSISFNNYLVIATKSGEGNWTHEEVFLLDNYNTGSFDGPIFPDKISDTYYSLMVDISSDDIRLISNDGGTWSRTVISNDPNFEAQHPQIKMDSQGNYHVFYFYRNSELNKNIVKHLTLSGSSVSTSETIELDVYTSVNYVYATIDKTTDDIYFAYTGFDGGYNEYLVHFDEGVKKEILLREDGYSMGYRALNANNGFVTFVTADEDVDSIYVTTNAQMESGTSQFDGSYNGSVTQEGVHIGTYTFVVTGNSLSGKYYGDNANYNLNGTVDNQGDFSISLNVDGATISVSGTIASGQLSGSWSSSMGDSGTIFGSSAIESYDGDYTGSAKVENSEIGTFSISIVKGLIQGSYSEEGETTSVKGYIETNGDMSFNIIFEDESITTIKASISEGEITGTFSNTLEGSGTISGSKSGTVSNEQFDSFPKDFTLNQNYPNPFNPSTTIRFGLPNASGVKIEIFNMIGQKVMVLSNNRYGAGWHTISFNASGLSSGIYIYRIRAGSFVETKRMTLIK